jgi:hypothetical protein
VSGALPDATHIADDVVQREARRLRNAVLAELVARIFVPWRRRATSGVHRRQA